MDNDDDDDDDDDDDERADADERMREAMAYDDAKRVGYVSL
jgi:hypothetical protein